VKIIIFLAESLILIYFLIIKKKLNLFIYNIRKIITYKYIGYKLYDNFG